MNRAGDLGLPLLTPDRLQDTPTRWPVVSHRTLADSHVVRLDNEEIRAPDGSVFSREIVRHPGAVAIVALIDDGAGSYDVVLVAQYRHPVGHRLLEIPAGLRDIPGEDPAVAAARELAEETGLRAERWNVLVDLFSSPGMTDEVIRVFVARDLSEATTDYVREAEEADMDVVRAPLAGLVTAVLAGQLHNAALVTGVLATYAALTGAGLDSLRRVGENPASMT